MFLCLLEKLKKNFMNQENKIIPYCKKFPGAFIEFTGLVTPCCWLVTDKVRHENLKNFMGDSYEKIFITSSKEEIKQAYKKIEYSWYTATPFVTCELVCSSKNKEHPLVRNITKPE